MEDPGQNEKQKQKTKKKVQVVYYLSHVGGLPHHLDHPHLIEAYLPSSQSSLSLKEVKKWMAVLRGHAMPNAYAWSCRRLYRNGYVWQDLSDNDNIQAVSACEYILMGSQIEGLACYNSGQGTCSSCSSTGGSGLMPERAVKEREKVYKKKTDATAAQLFRSEYRSMSEANRDQRNRVYKLAPLYKVTDAGTQTEEEEDEEEQEEEAKGGRTILSDPLKHNLRALIHSTQSPNYERRLSDKLCSPLNDGVNGHLALHSSAKISRPTGSSKQAICCGDDIAKESRTASSNSNSNSNGNGNGNKVDKCSRMSIIAPLRRPSSISSRSLSSSPSQEALKASLTHSPGNFNLWSTSPRRRSFLGHSKRWMSSDLPPSPLSTLPVNTSTGSKSGPLNTTTSSRSELKSNAPAPIKAPAKWRQSLWPLRTS